MSRAVVVVVAGVAAARVLVEVPWVWGAARRCRLSSAATGRVYAGMARWHAMLTAFALAAAVAARVGWHVGNGLPAAWGLWVLGTIVVG